MIEFITDTIVDFNYLVFGLIVLLYLALNSQIFYDKILSKFAGALNMGLPSNYGVLIQGLLMAFISMFIYKLYEHEII